MVRFCPLIKNNGFCPFLFIIICLNDSQSCITVKSLFNIAHSEMYVLQVFE